MPDKSRNRPYEVELHVSGKRVDQDLEAARRFLVRSGADRGRRKAARTSALFPSKYFRGEHRKRGEHDGERRQIAEVSRPRVAFPHTREQ